MNILVIDPDRIGRLLAGRLIERLGYPSHAQVESLEAAPAGNWSLALVDVGDRVSELQTLRHMLGAHLRLAVMVVRDDEETRRICRAAGADDVLLKPLTLDALGEVIARAAPAAGDFDRVTCADLRQLFGAAGLARLCRTLVDDLPVQRARLDGAVRDNDPVALKRLAHALRGVSLQLGASELAEAWGRVEQTAPSSDTVETRRRCAQLMDRHAALVERLRHESAAT